MTTAATGYIAVKSRMHELHHIEDDYNIMLDDKLVGSVTRYAGKPGWNVVVLFGTAVSSELDDELDFDVPSLAVGLQLVERMTEIGQGRVKVRSLPSWKRVKQGNPHVSLTPCYPASQHYDFHMRGSNYVGQYTVTANVTNRKTAELLARALAGETCTCTHCQPTEESNSPPH